MRISVLIFSYSISAFAADSFWNDAVNGSSWNFANHWSPSGVPGAANTAIFNTIATNLSDQFKISIIAPVTVGSMEFNNENPATGYWIFGMTPLQLNANIGNSFISVKANNHSQVLIDVPIILGKDLEIINGSANPIILNQKLSGASRNVRVAGLTEFSGSEPNSYTGMTKVKNGTLFLNKSKGVNAISGNLIIDSGSVEYLSDLQVANSSIVTLQDNAVFNLNSHQETIRTLQLKKSSSPNTVKIGVDGALSISDTLELADHSSIEGLGSLFLSGDHAKISFIGSTHYGQINTALHLGNQMRTIEVNANPPLSLNGPILDGGIIKTGAGILEIATHANLSGFVIEEGGVHLNGRLASVSPVQIYPDAFLYGKGSIDGNLVIHGTVSVGEIIPDNTSYDKTEYFSFDKVSDIENSKSQLLFLTGDFQSAHVSEGIHVNGDITFSPQSTLVIKFSPNLLSRIDTTGKIILDSTNILLSPTEGIYNLNQKYDILYAGSISGQIGTVSSRFALINPIISYITEDSYTAVSFTLSLNHFSDLFTSGNASLVAAYLDSLALDPHDNSPIIIEALINTPTLKEISDSLSQLQPSAFTSLPVSLENDLFYIRNSIYSRLYQEQQNCLCIIENECPIHVWGGAFGGIANQINQSGEPGFRASSPGAILAVDANIKENVVLGGAVGYLYTFHEWKRHRGDANIHTISGSIYSQYAKPTSFFVGNITGGYSFYDVDRKINLGPGNVLHANANSRFGGFEGSIDLKFGAHFPVRSTIITPFLGFDYMVVHQNEAHEHGARVLNLNIESHIADLLTSEGGFEFSFCHWKDQTFLKALLRLSAIAESRFFGKTVEASFHTGGKFKARGLYPSRVLGAFGAGLSASFDRSTIFISYQAKTNWNFTDQFLTLEYLWRF
ncbi:MAG TPA: autotransporter outer membrane beta-barrel domain-containing protein [Chlamydiales bacterium]|nr:autotransporter outer membrane beta-barrel domain-containing protein [Chlamydiales bacterium]